MNFAEKYPHLQCVDISYFSRRKGSCVFVAEASEIRYGGDRRVYNDACDIGLVISNRQRGTDILVTLLRVEEQNNEIEAWVYVASHEVKIPNIHDFEFVILND